MRVIHLTKKYPGAVGGDAVAVQSLESEQLRLGDEVFILTSNAPEIVQKENLYKFGLKDKAANLDRVTLRRLLSLAILTFAGFRYIKKLRPSVIHSHSADMGFFISIPARVYRVPVVNTAHSITFSCRELPAYKRAAEKFFLRHSGFRRIIVVDKKAVEQFHNSGIKNTYYIPNGVNLEEYRPRTEKGEKKEVRFLFVGRLEEEKGLPYLLKAVSLAKESISDFKVVLVGTGSQENALKKLSKDLGIEAYVTFTGNMERERMSDAYRTADVYVLASVREGMPVAVLEAMASGLPVIATDVGSISEIVKHGTSGLLVEPRSPEGLADAMMKMAADGELRKRLGANGRLQAQAYGWEQISERIREIYKEAICRQN